MRISTRDVAAVGFGHISPRLGKRADSVERLQVLESIPSRWTPEDDRYGVFRRLRAHARIMKGPPPFAL